METSVEEKGQTIIPADTRLVWLDDGEVIWIIPVPADPLKALRGAGRGERLLERLLSSRQIDR